MRPLLRNLHLEELIVHDIPKKLSQRILRQEPNIPGEQPVFSEVPSPINQDIVNFFHDRITATIGSNSAIDVVFNSATDSPIRTLVDEYFANENRRIIITQKIGQYLFNIQNAQNSSGLLLFVRCSIREQTLLAILKVERDEGIRIRQQIVQNGLRTFDVEHIRDLMLTKKTKLFKIVLFYIEENVIKGVLCDQQRGYSDKDVADFFLTDFLGCILTEEPQILTKKFFEATQKYINERIISAEQKEILMNHLISELTNQVTQINLIDFARRTLPVDQRDDYIRYIQHYNLVVGYFSKDISMIESKLKRVQYEFNSGIYVVGSQEALRAKTTISDTENGEMRIEIVDGLKQVNTK